MKKVVRYLILGFLLTFIVGLCIRQKTLLPVVGATAADWHPQSFWYYPWGQSVTHKGVDIFAASGTPVVAATSGFVVSSTTWGAGGTIVLILGPSWRLHYYAHLKTSFCKKGEWVAQGEVIGEVGTTGNAQGKAPHLHYSIVTLIPMPWRIDDSVQGWKKMFYLNPVELMGP